jgi:hypothetical protein
MLPISGGGPCAGDLRHCIGAQAGGEQMDAALPFLSFAAGAMAATEILKRGLIGYPFTTNRVILNTRPHVRAIPAALSFRPGCIASSGAHPYIARF